MMTLAQFKARTSGGINPKRSNLIIQQIDALLALYEAMDATMSLEERKDLAYKILDVANKFLDQDRIISSRKKAGVEALRDMSWREWFRHGQEIERLAAEQKAKLKQQQQAAIVAQNLQKQQQQQQQAALLAQQQQQLKQLQAAQQARAQWAAALAKVNRLLGPEGYRDVRAKLLDPSAWPEFFDPQHRPALVLGDAMKEWQKANTVRPFEVWLEKNFMPHHQSDPDYAQRVAYLSPEQREEYRVEITGGVFRWVEGGELLHTGSMTTHVSGQGHAIWVCSADRRFYSADHVVGSFHHSSFLSGLPVMGAGEWAIDQGRLTVISNRTGHYKATFHELFRVMLRLSADGVDMSSVAVFWPWPSLKERKFYRATDFMRARPVERMQEPLDQAGKPLIAVPAPSLPAPLAVT